MAGALITSDFQIQLGPDSGGLLLGAGTPYDVIELDGWDDLPPLSLTDVQRPNQAGAWAGPMYPQERVITLTLGVSGTVNGIGTTSQAQYDANLSALRAATNPAQDSTTEVPFVVQLAGRQRQANVRCQQRAAPITQGYLSPGLDRVTLQLVASDPRRYGSTVQNASCGLAVSGGGLTYPITYPIVWGASGGGSLTVDNQGDTSTPVQLVIAGPGTNPAVTRQDTGQVLQADVVLGAADQLAIDPLEGTVSLNGTPIYGVLDPSSAPPEAFLLPSGMTTLGLRATGTGTTLTATWQSAYL
ncbi:MAG: phage distal tail protein [Actinocrinis sp.]